MSGPAPATSRVAAQTRFEVATLLRNGEQLLVAIILPGLALLALTASSVPDLGPGRRVDVATAGVLALSVVSTAFTSQAISTGFDRRYGVLRLLGTTPLGRSGLLLGKAGAVLVIIAIQVGVLGGLAAWLGWRPDPGALVPASVALALGAGCFVALALLLAGSVRAEAVLALANLFWVLALGLGVLTPTSLLPGPLPGIAPYLPPGALGDALRAALLDGQAAPGAWAVLLAWAGGASALATRTFRWSP